MNYADAIELFRAVHDRLGEANALRAQGSLDEERERWPEGLAAYRSARDLYVQVDDGEGLSSVDADLARLHSAIGDPHNAIEAAIQALTRGAQVQNRGAVSAAAAVLRKYEDLIPNELRSQFAEYFGAEVND